MMLELLFRHEEIDRRDFYGCMLRTVLVSPAIGAVVFAVANLFAPDPFPAAIPAIAGAAIGALSGEATGVPLIKSSAIRYATAQLLALLLCLGLFVGLHLLGPDRPEWYTWSGVLGWLGGSHLIARALASPPF